MKTPPARLNRSSRTVLFFTIFAGLIALSWPMRSQAQAIGEVGLQIFTERVEDAAGNTSRERQFRVGLATGWTTKLNRPESQDAKVMPDGTTVPAPADAWVHRIGYGVSFRTDRGLHNGSSLSGYGVGVFVGWYAGPLSVRADYIALAEQKSDNGAVETAFREGSGYSIQARWLQWFGRYAFGPSLAYEQTTYAKSAVGTLPESSATRKVESITPGLTGVFHF